MTDTAGIAGVRRDRERTTMYWILAIVVVLMVGVIAWGAVRGGDGPAESEFLDRIRTDNPELSISDASDDELVAVARATCRPDGPSAAQREWLQDLHIDVDDLRDAATGLCPSR